MLIADCALPAASMRTDASPNNRGANDSMTSTAWMRSKRAARTWLVSTPRRTSTSSSLILKPLRRHQICETAKTTASAPTRPAAAHPMSVTPTFSRCAQW